LILFFNYIGIHTQPNAQQLPACGYRICTWADDRHQSLPACNPYYCGWIYQQLPIPYQGWKKSTISQNIGKMVP